MAEKPEATIGKKDEGNALSNFVADAPNVVGIDAFARLADWLEREAEAAIQDREPGRAHRRDGEGTGLVLETAADTDVVGTRTPEAEAEPAVVAGGAR